VAASINIDGQCIERGDCRDIELNIAHLPDQSKVALPISVYRAKEKGPSLLLTSGIHGDETNGIEIIRRLSQQELLRPDIGTIICLPLVNPYGFIYTKRKLPDGKDINRCFPGLRHGSLASQIAYKIQDQILPWVDYGIDFHTGSNARVNLAQLRCNWQNENNRAIAKACRPPVILHSSEITGSFRETAQNQGVQMLVYEGGETLRFDEEAIGEGVAITLRLLKHLSMIEEAPSHKSTEIYGNSIWIRADYSGFFNHKLLLGQYVEAEELLGDIMDPCGGSISKVKSPLKGRIIGLNRASVTYKGDALIHIATEIINTI